VLARGRPLVEPSKQNEGIHRRLTMIKSINVWALPGGLANQIDPVDAMRQAKEAGFEGIELGIGDAGVFTPQTDKDTCQTWAKEAKNIGIQIASVATGFYWGAPLTSQDADNRKKAYDFTVAMIERAGWLKAGAVLVVPGLVRADFIPNSPEAPYDFVYKTSQQQLKKLAHVAEKNKVVIGVENVWNNFLYSPMEMARFVDEIKSRWVGVYFDVGNPVAFGNSYDWIRILGRRIKRVHLKEYKRGRNPDGTVYWSKFPEGFEVPLGEGDVNWPKVKQALAAIKYKGPVTVEVLNFKDTPGVAQELSRQVDRVMF
jgi:L-ribulose-5-phosphate 3-epimerase